MFFYILELKICVWRAIEGKKEWYIFFLPYQFLNSPDLIAMELMAVSSLFVLDKSCTHFLYEDVNSMW
jgi:hypothetical protein